MAREHARILCSIWGDKDFQQRSPSEQRMYMLLLSQKTINNAGVLPLQPTKWARGSVGTTAEDVLADLKGLEENGFILVDHETEEVLVRSFIRNDGIVKLPNVLKSALKYAVQVESPRLRVALAAELRRLGLSIADRVADELDPNPSRRVPEPIAKGSGKGSGTLESPVDNSRVPARVREGFPEPHGEGVGEGVGEPLVGGSVGEGRAPAREEPPPLKCPKHINRDTNRPCHACGKARRAREEWEEADASRREHISRDIEAAVADPSERCDHGTPGGRFVHPVTGKSATCAHCRRDAPRSPT
jgi:hypothetical protein